MYAKYFELQCRTNFSFLEGASHPEEIVNEAAKKGLSGVAVTDRNGVYGLPKAFSAQKEIAGFRLISGSEVSLCDFPSVTMLAETKSGYGWMCRILSRAHEGKEKTNAHLTFEELLAFVQSPRARELTYLINAPLSSVASRYQETSEDVASKMGTHWGWDFEKRLGSLAESLSGKVYFPVRRHLDGLDRRRWEQALHLRSVAGVKLVATNDVHYHNQERARLQSVLTCIRKGVRLCDAGYHLFGNAERFLKSPLEMAELFRHEPELLRETEVIVERCAFTLSELRYRYPSEWIPEGMTAQMFLNDLSWRGAEWRYPGGIPEKVRAQMKRELELVARLEFADYFLTIWDIVQYARGKNILCQGRGSAANSIVCYCLGITAIDPVQMNLLFERFISAERGEPPDIDVDFEHERREEVIQYIYEKYGRDRAAMVATVIRYRSRSALREVTKVFDTPDGQMTSELNQVLSTFRHPRDAPRNLRDRLSRTANANKTQVASVGSKLLGQKSSEKSALPWDCFVQEIRDFPRHLGIHSGGFTLSADPMIEIVPIEPARMEKRTVIQWDKYDLDIVGLLKVDVLSLGMLTAIKKTMDLVGIRELADIPPDDPETYKMIQRADTVGVFQIESRAQMNMLGRLQPKNFYDLVIEVAIVRPGPIVGKMVHPYLKRRRKLEAATSPDPRLEPILGKTLGVPIFQEQIMQIAIQMAGFSPGEADQLRRAIGAWRSSGSLEKWGRRLQHGLLDCGLPPEWVERIFLQIQGFAEYGFPESHAASFALITYASCFLKRHHAAAFTASLVNSQPMGFYSVSSLFEEAKRSGVKILPICLYQSQWDCTIEAGAIRSGLRLVHGLPKASAQKVVVERELRPFRDLHDFLYRIRIRSNVLQKMALMGLFQIFGYTEREALWAVVSYQVLNHQEGEQLHLWSQLRDVPSDSNREWIGPLNALEKMKYDYEGFGLSLSGHPMSLFRQLTRKLPKLRLLEIRKQKHGVWTVAAGLVIVRQRPGTAKGTTFATLEDETGLLDLILHREVSERYKEVFLTHSFVIARGILQRDHFSVSLVVKHIGPLPLAEVQKQAEVTLPRMSSRDFH